jgi:hypothetical protein
MRRSRAVKGALIALAVLIATAPLEAADKSASAVEGQPLDLNRFRGGKRLLIEHVAINPLTLNHNESVIVGVTTHPGTFIPLWRVNIEGADTLFGTGSRDIKVFLPSSAGDFPVQDLAVSYRNTLAPEESGINVFVSGYPLD